MLSDEAEADARWAAGGAQDIRNDLALLRGDLRLERGAESRAGPRPAAASSTTRCCFSDGSCQRTGERLYRAHAVVGGGVGIRSSGRRRTVV